MSFSRAFGVRIVQEFPETSVGFNAMPYSILRLAWIAAALLAILGLGFPLQAGAQSGSLPVVTLLQPEPGLEGDADHAFIIVHWRLSRMSESESRFTVETRVPTSGTRATPGVDYEPIAPEEWVIPPYLDAGTIVVYTLSDRIQEPDETLEVRLSGFEGMTAGEGVSELVVTATIKNDDFNGVPDLVGNDDHVTFEINSQEIELFPQENDIQDTSYFTAGSLVATSQPRHGSLQVVDQSQYNQPDRWFYLPDQDFAGQDDFGYRVCLPESACVEARVRLQGRLTVPQTGSGYSGSRRVDFSKLPALADARISTSELVPLQAVGMQMTVDQTPHLAWDSRAGMAWQAYTLPASPEGSTREYRIFARHDGQALADLRVGVDADGDGAPSPDEQACLMRVSSRTYQECEVSVLVSSQPVTYWVALHSQEPAPLQATIRVAHAQLGVVGPALVATGPTTSEHHEPVALRVAWKHLLALVDDEHIGFIGLMDGSQAVGTFRMHTRGGGDTVYLPANDSIVVDVAASFGLHKLFLDVPDGASQLSVTVRSDKPMRVLLVRAGWINGRESIPEPAFAPPDAGWVAIEPGQARTLDVANPGLGRWYLAVQNGNQRARLSLSNVVRANAPAIRPGSYFNEFQPGSGLILYPAGEQLAGLWYTYSAERQPTWYYLQATKPGADGTWHSPIYRTAWNDGVARNVRVGVVHLTPVLPGWFFMSYELDGFVGSQPMSELGRGCPSIGGQVVDASSHWFDPARSGTGYSVQTWPHYEFYAAFTYNRQGVPVFFAAEGPFVPSQEASFQLETLVGTCPSCELVPQPTRRPVGTLTRVLQGGGLARIELDVDFDEGPPLGGRTTWSVVDQVQPLGGPGTTQGCAP